MDDYFAFSLRGCSKRCHDIIHEFQIDPSLDLRRTKNRSRLAPVILFHISIIYSRQLRTKSLDRLSSPWSHNLALDFIPCKSIKYFSIDAKRDVSVRIPHFDHMLLNRTMIIFIVRLKNDDQEKCDFQIFLCSDHQNHLRLDFSIFMRAFVANFPSIQSPSLV
jgi:hypothetical protein